MKLLASLFSIMLCMMPLAQAGTNPNPNVNPDGSQRFLAGRLLDLVAETQLRIPYWQPKNDGGRQVMPNIIFCQGTHDALVPTVITLRDISPVQVLTLMVEAAGCTMEPVTAIKEEGDPISANGRIIGYRIVNKAGRTKTATSYRFTETKLPASARISVIEEEIIRLARERLEQTRKSYEAKHVSLSEVEDAEGELALAEARSDLRKRAEARLSMAARHLERLEEVHRTDKISEAEYSRARQGKLEAELELLHLAPQRAPLILYPKTEKKADGDTSGGHR